MQKSVPVVILAGGQGARIGGDKPGRQLAGESLLARAISRATRYSSPVAVSFSDERSVILGNVARLRDDKSVSGPIAGLAAAIKYARELGAQHVMIMPCDTPFLPDDLLERMLHEVGASAAALAKYDGWLHPACSLWRTDIADLIVGYLAEGRRSLIGLANTVGHVAVEWTPQITDPFFNINDMEDLKGAERIFAQIGPNT